MNTPDWKRIDELRQELRALLLLKVDELGTPLVAPRTIDVGRMANTPATGTSTTRRPGRTRARGISQRVVNYLAANPRTPVNARAIAQAIGTPRKTAAVQSALARLVRAKHIRKMGAGRYGALAGTGANGGAPLQ